MTNDAEERLAFERWIQSPPFELPVHRKGQSTVWPGSYHRYEVELAWEAWCARAEVERDKALAEVERLKQVNQRLRSAIQHLDRWSD